MWVGVLRIREPFVCFCFLLLVLIFRDRAGLELWIVLPLPLECWDYRSEQHAQLSRKRPSGEQEPLL
jgi:hypothetical protein